MILELVLMIVAVLVIVALFVHKNIEVARGLKPALHEARQKSDAVIHGVNQRGAKFFSYFTFHNFILLLNYAFVHTVRFFMRLSRKVHDVSSNLVEKASKKTEDLSKASAASFYIKQIKDVKESGVEME